MTWQEAFAERLASTFERADLPGWAKWRDAHLKPNAALGQAEWNPVMGGFFLWRREHGLYDADGGDQPTTPSGTPPPAPQPYIHPYGYDGDL